MYATKCPRYSFLCAILFALKALASASNCQAGQASISQIDRFQPQAQVSSVEQASEPARIVVIQEQHEANRSISDYAQQAADNAKWIDLLLSAPGPSAISKLSALGIPVIKDVPLIAILFTPPAKEQPFP